MSLDWNIEKVQGKDNLCWVLKDDGDPTEDKDYRINPLTETLIFATMSVGIGKITEGNWAEFYARLKVLETIDGPFLRNGDGSEWLIEPADVENHIGLSTNATARDKTRPQWFRDHFQVTLDVFKRNAVRENSTR
jgi:hypothetical protein